MREPLTIALNACFVSVLNQVSIMERTVRYATFKKVLSQKYVRLMSKSQLKFRFMKR